MLIAHPFSFTLGRFTVQARPRPDNPYWLVYIIILGKTVVGKSFSRPGLSDCQYLESQGAEFIYAPLSAQCTHRHSQLKSSKDYAKQGRERARAPFRLYQLRRIHNHSLKIGGRKARV